METTHKIKVNNLWKPQEFDAELFKHMANTGCSQVAAFDYLNEIFCNENDRLRYASYNSYIVTRSKRLKLRK